MSTSLALAPDYAVQKGPIELFDLPDIVEAIGGERFAEQLLSCFDNLVGADHCSVYQLRSYELSEVAKASLPGAGDLLRSDLTPYEVKRQLSMSGSEIRVDVACVQDKEMPGHTTRTASRRQRIVICARRQNTAYCIRVMRSAHRPELTAEEIETLRSVAGILVSAVVKHLNLTLNRPNLTPALCSLQEIEQCVLTNTSLSRREGEVCARILYGLSSYGIALDLGIGKESVMTYRKRAYQRLGIGSQRELLMWYLVLWSALNQPEEPTGTLN